MSGPTPFEAQQRQHLKRGRRSTAVLPVRPGTVTHAWPDLTSEQITDACILLGAGQTRTAVAAKLRVSRWTLSRALDTASR